MPELPEVETVRRGLENQILNISIKKINVLYSKMIIGDKEEFISKLSGKKIYKIDRRGKYLLFRFSKNLTMISHLRMEGKYIVEDHNNSIKKHTHIIFELDDGRDLRYNDSRKFGRVQLVNTGDEFNLKAISKLGPEPLSKDFTIKDFYLKLLKKRKKIKTALLDQTVVAGLGNIYVDEVLWMSKIHPETPTNHLSVDDAVILHNNIIKELNAAIQAQGTTVFSFKNVYSHSGSFQNQLKVYRKTGLPCSRCGTPIERLVVGQRGTHICPLEQKIK